MTHWVAIFEELPQLVEIRCVNLSGRRDPCERARAVGGVSAGVTWSLHQEEAIAAIETGIFRFIVRSPRRSAVAILVASASDGRRYLKGAWDSVIPTTLLALPNCCPLRRHPPRPPTWVDTLDAPYGHGVDPRFWENRYLPDHLIYGATRPLGLDPLREIDQDLVDAQVAA